MSIVLNRLLKHVDKKEYSYLNPLWSLSHVQNQWKVIYLGQNKNNLYMLV